MQQVVRRIGVLSCGKIVGIIYASLGLIFGAIFSLLSIFGAVVGSLAAESAEPIAALFFGVGAVVILPLFYGVMGFVGGVITAAVYNLAAGFVGGLRLEIE